MRKLAFISLLVLSLVGCVSTGPIKPEQKENLKNVAVVSILGDKLEFTKVGFTVFNNDHFVRDTNNWSLDNQVQSVIEKQLLQTSPNIKIASVAFDRSQLFKVYKSPDDWGDYTSLDRIEPELKSKLTQTPVDAVFLVHKLRSEDPIAFTSIYIEGYGIYYRTLPFVDPLMKPYALFGVTVLDGKTLKPITTKYVRGISTQYGKTQTDWDSQLKNNMSEKMLEDFRVEINNVIKTNLEGALVEMGF